MKLTEGHTVWRLIDTERGVEAFADLLIRNDCFDAMKDFIVDVGKAVDEIAKKHQIPFAFEAYYTHQVLINMEESQNGSKNSSR